ncbi:MAG: hypothetical protein LUG16_04905 [Candidatus Gastranaerophilales bacterium]|nr:hypothetical protein [Candidatus Gastranaerophilales bacterium]
MKKIIIAILILILTPFYAAAQEQQKIQFIYINGSNNNDEKMENWFYDGVKKMHPNMVNAFNNSDFIFKHFLKNGKYQISDTAGTFFWGRRSVEEIQMLNNDLNITKIFSPRLAQTVRTLLAYFLHDAIWVSHYRNMHPLIEDLHKQVLENWCNGNSVVLFGYSAGAFITYEYMFNKLPDIDIESYFNTTEISSELRNYILKNKKENSCIDALLESGIAIYSADGKLVLNKNEELLKSAYDKLDDYSCKYCIPKGALKGIVNFASPLVLFYSDISNPNYSLTSYNKLLYKYMLENDMFWLTVNYADDPMGYPTSKNISYEELKSRLDTEIDCQEGFLYSKSDIKSRKTFLRAHTSYWATSKKFSKAVVEAYEEGYNLYNQ